MIAAADGSLYLISASHSVFNIDVNSRTAKYKGGIEGLPGNYTSNGAVVGNNGKLIVSSANSTEGYYEVDLKTWKATKVKGNGAVFNTSDLANGNIAFENETRRRANATGYTGNRRQKPDFTLSESSFGRHVPG
jgi:hypothetical protein